MLGLSELDRDIGTDGHNKKVPPRMCRDFRPFRGRFNENQIDLFRLTFIKRAEVRCYGNKSISPQRPNAQSKTTDPRPMSSLSKVTPLPPTEGGEAASRVASIVVETDKKGRCEERRFDNRTGKMVSANYVNCDARLEPERDTTPSENINRERIRAILGAFKK
jgi:hypothetical protein